MCGLQLFSTLTWAHIHSEDAGNVVHGANRVFRLCWTHHHGFYDQGYISTEDLLHAEDVWISNKGRPKPHPRDQVITDKVRSGKLVRRNRWIENRGKKARLAKEKQIKEQEQAEKISVQLQFF